MRGFGGGARRSSVPHLCRDPGLAPLRSVAHDRRPSAPQPRWHDLWADGHRPGGGAALLRRRSMALAAAVERRPRGELCFEFATQCAVGCTLGCSPCAHRHRTCGQTPSPPLRPPRNPSNRSLVLRTRSRLSDVAPSLRYGHGVYRWAFGAIGRRQGWLGPNLHPRRTGGTRSPRAKVAPSVSGPVPSLLGGRARPCLWKGHVGRRTRPHTSAVRVAGGSGVTFVRWRGPTFIGPPPLP